MHMVGLGQGWGLVAERQWNGGSAGIIQGVINMTDKGLSWMRGRRGAEVLMKSKNACIGVME